MVTTSQTCIGCAESSVRVGIRRITYGNTAKEIEAKTPFKEGPLDPDYFSNSFVEEVKMPDASDFRAFDLFRTLCDQEPDRKYLD
jgi:hypothetical protein